VYTRKGIKGSNPFSSASFKGWTQVCPFLCTQVNIQKFTTTFVSQNN